ncbi:hypothetical protein E1091_00310 [Micromonospora fluostatini]|uniref:Nuclear transport factor 2 family protein n=1 Tax=Micromonospora fluostatini TaxID=1629071 RepID=A0ABY2DPJ9_9ACTN|nr:hypothetical protein E1091_00310 [Micromonospora fluostatini]
MALPTREQLLALDEEAWDALQEDMVEAGIARTGAKLAAEVRRRVLADADLMGDFRYAQPVTAVFGSTVYDNGWFYDTYATLTFSDGGKEEEYDLSDEGGEPVRIEALVADLSGYDAVGSTSTMTLNLTNGSVEFDTYGNN